MMIDVTPRRWWLPVLRGVLAILFGLAALLWSSATLEVLVLLLGAFLVIDGAITVAGAPWRSGRPALSLALPGVVSVLGGLVALLWPDTMLVLLIYVVAAWAIFKGLSDIVEAFKLRRSLGRAAPWPVGGIVALLLGLVLIAWPVAGAVAVAWPIALIAIVIGLVSVQSGLSIRRRLKVR